MNTHDARHRLLELTHQAADIVERLTIQVEPPAEDRSRMRELLREAREVAYDAGFPGDAAWRAILQAAVTVTAPHEPPDRDAWLEILENLREGENGLSLVTGARAEG